MRFPADENNLSLGTDVAGQHKYFWATAESLGYEDSLFFHQSKISNFSESGVPFESVGIMTSSDI